MKEKTVSYFVLRHHQSIEDYTRDKRESVKKYAIIVWAPLKFLGMPACPTVFP